MNDFKLVIRSGCFICGGRGCKTKESIRQVPKGGSILVSHHICRRVSLNFGEAVNGYISITKNQKDQWVTYISESDFTQLYCTKEISEADRQKHLEAVERYKQENEKQKQERLGKLLDDDKRDYKQIADRFGLSSQHREEAKRRKATDEEIDFAISHYYWSSWHHGESFPRLSTALSGINPANQKTISFDGLAIYCSDGENLTGAQVRPDSKKHRDEYGKYLWVSSANCGGNGISLKSGEQPIFVWRYPGAEIAETWLIEGGLKSSLVALKLWHRLGRRNIQVIGSAGANWAGSRQAVEAALAADRNESKLIILQPDAGSAKNKTIINQYKKAVEWLAKTHTVKIGWWGQLEKGTHPDIDELTDFSSIQYLSFGEFSQLAGGREDKSTPQRQAAPESSENVSDLDWHKWVKSLKFTPTSIISQEDFTFPVLPKVSAIISVKSGMGTGKTKALLEVIKNSPNRAFLLGCLNNLLLQTISRGEKEGITIYHLRIDDAGKLVKDVDTHITTCVDSMQHLDGYFDGVDLFIDEICSVINHILSGGTLGDRQAYIMKVFENAVRKANRVFILDANNNDLITNFISRIDPRKQVVKILNQAKPRPHHFIFVNGFDSEKNIIKQRDKSPLIKMMLESGINPFIASDSREFTDIIHEWLNQEGKRGYALNKNTVAEDWAKLFLNDPNSFFETQQLDYFAISPTANSGISITNSVNFTHKFTIFHGVLTTNQQSQILMRLRPQLEHYVYCPKFSTIQNGESAKTPANYRANLLEKVFLSSSLLDIEDNQFRSKIIEDGIKKATNDIWFNLSVDLGALDNYERENLRKCLIYKLQEQGHTVEERDLEISKEHQKKYQATKDIIITKEAEEQYKSQPFDTVEEANREARKNPKKEVRRRIELTRLLDRLPGINNTEIWQPEFIKNTIKDPEYITRHQRFWLLQNIDISRKKSEVNWFYKATSEHFYLGSFKDAHLKIWALKQLNIMQFLDGREYHKNSPEVLDFYNQVRKNREIFIALGVKIPKPTVKGNERIKLLKQCLKYIGIKIKSTGRKLVNGVRRICYTLDKEAFSDLVRIEILNAVDRKFGNYLESKAVKQLDWEGKAMEMSSNNLGFTDADKVLCNTELLRECLQDNSLTWEQAQSLFVLCDDGTKKAIWQQLSTVEKAKLKNLQPSTIEGQWCKYFIDATKFQDSGAIEEAAAKFRDFLASVSGEQKQIIQDCLPQHLISQIGG
jgi:hypothetical protein